MNDLGAVLGGIGQGGDRRSLSIDALYVHCKHRAASQRASMRFVNIEKRDISEMCVNGRTFE